MNDTFESLFSKIGSYRSLQKDVQLLTFFMMHPHETIRQKQIIKYFEGKISAKTVRAHLYNLVHKGVIQEDSRFKGSYMFYPEMFEGLGVDIDRLICLIVGEDLYNLARKIWVKKSRMRSDDWEQS
jgi:hypothetical protein